jgi:Uma2 family endonuclease
MAAMVAVISTRVAPVTVAWWEQFEPPNGYRAEVIGGELVVTPIAGPGHQHAAVMLAHRLLTVLEATSLEGYSIASPGQWRLDDGGLVARAPEPDIVVRRLDRARHIDEAPVLAVEILSPTDRRQLEGVDLSRIEAKRLDYAEGGLTDYLEVELTEGESALRRYELHDGVLVEVDVAIGDQPLVAARPFAYRLMPSSLVLPPEK